MEYKEYDHPPTLQTLEKRAIRAQLNFCTIQLILAGEGTNPYRQMCVCTNIKERENRFRAEQFSATNIGVRACVWAVGENVRLSLFLIPTEEMSFFDASDSGGGGNCWKMGNNSIKGVFTFPVRSRSLNGGFSL